jgi:hypothetical protein
MPTLHQHNNQNILFKTFLREQPSSLQCTLHKKIGQTCDISTKGIVM